MHVHSLSSRKLADRRLLCLCVHVELEYSDAVCIGDDEADCCLCYVSQGFELQAEPDWLPVFDGGGPCSRSVLHPGVNDSHLFGIGRDAAIADFAARSKFRRR